MACSAYHSLHAARGRRKTTAFDAPRDYAAERMQAGGAAVPASRQRHAVSMTTAFNPRGTAGGTQSPSTVTGSVLDGALAPAAPMALTPR
jgi:hypothetical protein